MQPIKESWRFYFYIFKKYNEPISIGKTYVGNIYVAYLSVDLKMDIIDVT